MIMKTLAPLILKVLRRAPDLSVGLKIQDIDAAIHRLKDHPIYSMETLRQVADGLLKEGKVQRSRWGWLRVTCDLPMPEYQIKRALVNPARVTEDLLRVMPQEILDQPLPPLMKVVVKSPSDILREQIVKILEASGPGGTNRKVLYKSLRPVSYQDVYTSLEWLISVGIVKVCGWKMVCLARPMDPPAVQPEVPVVVAEAPVAVAPPPKPKTNPGRNQELMHRLHLEAKDKGMIGRVFRVITEAGTKGQPMSLLSQISGNHQFKRRIDAARDAVEKLEFAGLIERSPSRLYRVVPGKTWEDLTDDVFRAMTDRYYQILVALTQAGVALTVDDIARKIDGAPEYTLITWTRVGDSLKWLVDTGRVVRYERGVYGLPGALVVPAPKQVRVAPPVGLRRMILKVMRVTHEPMALKDIVAALDGKTNHKNREVLRVAVAGDLSTMVKTRQVKRVSMGIYVPRQNKGQNQGVKSENGQSMTG